MTTTTLTVLPQAQTCELREGETLLSALRRQPAGPVPASPCGGKHTCGKCRILIKSGSVSAPTETELSFLSPEDIQKGVRLACFATAVRPMSPAVVELINRRP
jgi:ferredoxin